MTEICWVLLDSDGGEMRRTGSFESQEAAEAWMGSEWGGLLEEGAAAVVLEAGGRRVYRMGLEADR